jgi:hypothetical protein
MVSLIARLHADALADDLPARDRHRESKHEIGNCSSVKLRREGDTSTRGIGVERLRDAPAEWRCQFEALGLNPQ